MLFSLLLASALAAPIDPIVPDYDSFTDYHEVATSALTVASQAPGVLRLGWHEPQGPELYDAVCVTVYSKPTADTVLDLVVTDLNASTHLHDQVVWYGSTTVTTTMSGDVCIPVSSGTVVDSSYFNVAETRLELLSGDRIGKGMVSRDSALNVRCVSSTSGRNFGRVDVGGLMKPITGRAFNGITSGVPTDLASETGGYTTTTHMPTIFFRKD